MDYEKLYKDALERAKNTIEVNQTIPDIVECVESLFPELAESEDERIRKAIGYAIGQSTHSDGTLINGVSSEEALAWLEKQGEHANFINKIQIGDKVTRNQDGVLVNLSQLKRVAKKDEKQGEQKPAEWSEEDETGLGDALWCCKQAASIAKNENDMGNAWYAETWLKSLKDRVQPQPKQEWSQNDIDMIDWLIRCCEKEHEELCNDKYGHQDIVSDLKRDCRKKWNWLESLKNKVVPQNKWKPSDEQMKALESATENCAYSEYQDCLRELIEQLKTLKG